MTRQPGNGRRLKSWTTREAVLSATRKLMVAGNFRPTAKEIGQADGFAPRSLHEHFPTMDALYSHAVDRRTAEAIVNQLPAHDHRLLALTVVLGRIP